jgi:UDP-2,3-diacylglucosamine hydrolase
MIGLIFGESKLPLIILNKFKKKKYKYIIIDLTKKNIFKKNKFSYTASVGQFGKIIKIFKDNKCKKVLFAGTVKKPKLSKLKLDLKGIYYMPRIIKGYKLGDAAILSEIIQILKREKIETLNTLTFNKELSLKKGNYSKFRPNKKDNIDIKKAITTLKNIGKYNFTQATVIRNGKVIAIEGKGGTEKMLNKCVNKKFKNNGVLVKFPKEGQDLRIDLPTVGIKTFYQCKNSGLKGIVLKNNKNIVLEKKKCINFANKNKMFITVK